MRNQERGVEARRGTRGFTLIELFVVLAVLGVAMALGIPAIQNLIVRSRTEGYAREASVLMQRTRLEAIKMTRDGVVHMDTANRRLVAFIDADRDGTFNPNPGAPYRTADYVLGRLDLPEHVQFEDEAGNVGASSVLGDTTVEVGGAEPPAVIFLPGGSIVAPSTAGGNPDGAFAFRVADVRGNCLEVRVHPPATGRIGVRKWQDDEWLATVDPSADDYTPWKWN